RAVPRHQVHAGTGQSGCHGCAHPAGADPAHRESRGTRLRIVHLTHLSHLLVQSFAIETNYGVGPCQGCQRPAGTAWITAFGCSREATQSAVYGRCHGATFAQPWLPSSSISSSTSPSASP